MKKNESHELDDKINDLKIVEEPYIRYPKIKLGKIAQIKGGKRLPKGENLVNTKTDHPYIRAQDIRDGLISFNDPVYVTKPIFEKIKNYTVKENDICITIVGANVGDVGIVPKFLNGANLTENAVKLTDLRNDCNSYFLKYILLSNGVQKHMKLFAGGAAQPKLGLYKINEVEIPFPPLPSQRKIASILSAYDDLIENNTRRIKILEKMAQALYREWFVEFRFPGHENVKMVESELGMVPEGWEVKRLEDVCLRITDGSHWSPKTVDDGYPMASVKDMNQWGFEISQCRKIAKEDYEELIRNDCKPLKGDVLIAKDGSYLKHIFVTEKELELVILSSIAIIRPNNQILPHVLSLYLCEPSIKDRMAGYVSGVAIPRIVLKDFRKFPLIVPEIDIQKQFFNLAEPMIKNCYRLIEKNANLRRTRDLLLPKLISGEVDVENIDILVQ